MIYTPLADDPTIADVEPLILPAGAPQRIASAAERDRCEISVHHELVLADRPLVGEETEDAPSNGLPDPGEW